jgi:hypothetical protein
MTAVTATIVGGLTVDAEFTNGNIEVAVEVASPLSVTVEIGGGGISSILKDRTITGNGITTPLSIQPQIDILIGYIQQLAPALEIDSITVTWDETTIAVTVVSSGGLTPKTTVWELEGTTLTVTVTDAIGTETSEIVELSETNAITINSLGVTWDNGFVFDLDATGGFGDYIITYVQTDNLLDVTVTDQIGITATTQLDLDNISPIVIASINFEVEGEVAEITCVASGGFGDLLYSLYFGDEFVESNSTGIFEVETEGSYYVVVPDEGGATQGVSDVIQVVFTVDIPLGLTLTALSQTSIKIDWICPEDVEIYASTDGTNFSLVDTVLKEVETYTHTPLTIGAIYYYKIRAKVGTRFSDYTAVKDEITHTPEYTTYVNGLAVALSVSQATKINKTVRLIKVGLVINNLSDAFDNLYLWRNTQEEAALRNLVKNAHYATNVNSVFTINEGFRGNGVNQLINLNYNPNTQGVKYTRYSCSLGVYINDNLTASTYHDTGNDTGGTNRNYINTRNAGNLLEGSANADFLTADITGGTSVGLSMISRISQTEVIMYKNGANVTKTITAATAVSSAAAAALAATNYSPRSQGACFWGRGFSVAELDVIDAAFDFYFYDPINDEYFVDEGPDDYPILQSMIDNAAEESTVTFGTDISDLYRLSQPLVFKSNVNYVLKGILKVKKGRVVALTADCPIGQQYVEVESPEYFAIGQWITTIDDRMLDERELYFGWGGKIVDIVENKIYLENANPYVEILVSENARCGHSQGCVSMENLDNVSFTGTGIIDGNRFNQIAVLPYAGLDLHGHWEHQRCAMALVVWACHDTIVGDGLKVRNGLAHSISISGSLLPGGRINERLTVRNIEASGAHDKNILVRFIDDATFENIYTHHAGWEDGMIFYSHCRNYTVDGVLATHNPRYGFAVNGAAGNINANIQNITSEFNSGNSGILIAGRETTASHLIVKDRFTIGSNFESWDITIDDVQITSAAGIYTTIFSVGVSKRVAITGLVMTNSVSKTGSYAIGVSPDAEDCSITDGSISNHTGAIISQAQYDNCDDWTDFTGLVIS